jgi:hypothetical protein
MKYDQDQRIRRRLSTRTHGLRRYHVCIRATRRSVAVVPARNADHACTRVADWLSREIAAPMKANRLRALLLTTRRLPKGMPWYDDEYFSHLGERRGATPDTEI